MRSFSAALLLAAMVSTSCTASPTPSGELGEAVPPMDTPVKKLLFYAEEELVSRCMAEEGLLYPDAAAWSRVSGSFYGTDDPSVNAGLGLFEWRFDNAETAARHGFVLETLIGAGTEEPVAQPDGGPDFGSMTQDELNRYDAVLGGSGAADSVREIEGLVGEGTLFASQEGCVGAARVEMYGSIENYLLVVSYRNLASLFEGADAVNQNADYKAALERWSSCMDRSGFDVSRPSEAGQLALSRAGEGDLDVEFTVAVATAECNAEAELRAAGDEALDGYFADLTKEFGPRVGAVRDAVNTAVSQARRVLADSAVETE